MKVVHGSRYRRNRMRMLALIIVVFLTIFALFAARPNSDSFEKRTENWATTRFSDYGLTIAYPTTLELSVTGDTLASLGGSEEWIEIKVFANADNESLEEWTRRIHSVEATTVSPRDDLAGAQATLSWGGTVSAFEHNERIYEVISSIDEQTRNDFLQSLFLTDVAAATDAQGRARMLELTDVAFKELFDSLKLPGTKQITEKPTITGDQAADAHIQMLAEARGYRLQADVDAELGSADGYSLQTETADAWRELKAAAVADGIALSVTSGYRSVDSQQQIFTSRLAVACGEVYGSNCSSEQIASGDADQAIDEVLATSSIPGYSRHHSGHTVDIGQDGVGAFEDFFGTPGWDWISANNYENAKRFGFIPSYPPNAGLQGPDPEPWEYVYVDADFFRVGE